MPDRDPTAPEVLESELIELLHQIEEWLEGPMVVLAFVWLALTIAEFVWDLGSPFGFLVSAIWVTFILDFLLRLALAPKKLAYFKRNWLTALSLGLPALRIFRLGRVLRVVRATRGLRLIRAVSSVNRGVRALRASMGRRGVGYVMSLTLVVALTGAAAMLAFESRVGDAGGFQSYWDALWWTAMILTATGSEYWPVTAEGRLVCLLISIYSLGILGYVTATLASFFVGRDAEDDRAEIAGAHAIETLRREITALRADLALRSDEG